MPTILSNKERQQLLKTRARRLLFFVEEYKGRQNRAVELEAYLVLQTYVSRPRAIWRYLSFALRDWLKTRLFIIERDALVFYYRRVRRLDLSAAIEQAHQVIERRSFGPEEGGRGCS